MNDFSELDITGKEMAVLVLVVLVFMVVIFTIGYMFGLRSVHSDGGGTASIGNQIGNAATDIGNAASGIHEAKEHADQVASGIESAKESANYIQGTANTSAGIISECQQILAGIRSRGKTETIKN